MNTILSIQAILDRLGYTKATSFEGGEAGTLVSGVVGVYRYATSADATLVDRPVVYIAEAKDEAQARQIHRKLWNQGDCPFLFIFLPTELMVYSGFNHPTARDEVFEPLFKAIQRTADEIDKALQKEKALQSFASPSIDNGHVWSTWGNQLSASKRVDKNLLRNLRVLSEMLQGPAFELPQRLAHALIGKYIYFRYLKDREILTDGWLSENGIDTKSVFGRDASVSGFARLSDLLQETLNGDLFPISKSDRVTESAIKFIAAIFSGDDAISGQMSIFDATVFTVYQFEYIPVELLSSIYEQFLHERNVTDQMDRGGGAGAYYTPKPVADYVISELQANCPLNGNTRVLDPSCGSGVFLVLAYQRLVALHKREKGRDLTRFELREILTANIFGIEINEEACGIAEFSLLLALMSNLKPRDLQQNQGFQFPKLRNQNIIKADFFADNYIFLCQMRFRWIAGNPPWFTVPVKRPDDLNRAKEWDTFEKWLQEARIQDRVIGNRRTCEAFCWRASDLITDDGCIALLIHATTLVNSGSSEFRTKFFSQLYVRSITNFSNLASHLFESSDAPGAVIIYKKQVEVETKQAIIHFAPFIVNQTALQHTSRKDGAWVISLNKDEIQWVQYEDAETDQGNLWKICLWGTYHDRRTLQRLRRLFPLTLGSVIEDGKKRSDWRFGRGPEMNDRPELDDESTVYQQEFENKDFLDMKLLNRVKPRPHFNIPASSVRKLDADRYYTRKRSGYVSLVKAPHAIVNASFAIYSSHDFIIPHPQIGLSVSLADAGYLKAICLFLNTSISRYMLFFTSAMWGVSVDSLNPEDIRHLPFPQLSTSQIDRLENEYDRFSQLEADFVQQAASQEYENFELAHEDFIPILDLQSDIDAIVGTILQIPPWITILAQEFMSIRYQLKKGKVEETGKKGQWQRRGLSPVGIPTDSQLIQYAEQLRNELDVFAHVRHQVNIERSTAAIVATVEITENAISKREALPVSVITAGTDINQDGFLKSVREERSQWVYIQRSVKHFDGDNCIHLLKQNRLLDWTQTQAFLDAGDIIGSVLAAGK